jgi:hypothetical protein
VAVTYSQSIAGLNQTMFEPKILTVNDTYATGLAQAGAMSDNVAFLCKNPDGSQGLYQIDAERSIPGQPPILRALFP